MDYTGVKFLHVLLATLVFAMLAIRGLWLLGAYPAETDRAYHTSLKVALACLFGAGIGLALSSEPAMAQNVTLMVEVLVSCIFACLYLIAHHFGPSRRIRIAAWGLSMLAYIQVILIAQLNDPRGALALPPVIERLVELAGEYHGSL